MNTKHYLSAVAHLILFLLLIQYSNSAEAQLSRDCFKEKACVAIDMDLSVLNESAFNDEESINGVRIDFNFLHSIDRSTEEEPHKWPIYYYLDSSFIRSLNSLPNGAVHMGEVEVGIGRKDFDFDRNPDAPVYSTQEIAVRAERNSQYEKVTIFLPMPLFIYGAFFSRIQTNNFEVSVRPNFIVDGQHINPLTQQDYEYDFGGWGMEFGVWWRVNDRLSTYNRLNLGQVSGDILVNGEDGAPARDENEGTPSYDNLEFRTRFEYQVSPRISAFAEAEFRRLFQPLRDEVVIAFPELHQREYGYRFSIGAKIRH